MKNQSEQTLRLSENRRHHVQRWSSFFATSTLILFDGSIETEVLGGSFHSFVINLHCITGIFSFYRSETTCLACSYFHGLELDCQFVKHFITNNS